MKHQFQSCLEAAKACASACEECCAACIEENHPECVKLTGDCAQLCWNLCSFISRGSEMVVPYLAKLCEEVCEACVKECGLYQDSDHHQNCVEACNACIAECKKIAGRLPGFERMKTSSSRSSTADVSQRL